VNKHLYLFLSTKFILKLSIKDRGSLILQAGIVSQLPILKEEDYVCSPFDIPPLIVVVKDMAF
jgi:hypothetical protein